MKPPLKEKPSCYRPKIGQRARRTSLTLCIAAACADKKGGNVVIGTDWRVSGEIAAGADIQDKLYWINDDIAVLVSGIVTRAVELRDAYKTELEEMKARGEKLTSRNVRKYMKAGPRRLKKDIAEETVVFATGLSYEEFRKAVKNGEITSTVATGVFRAIEQKDLECEIIVVIFINRVAYIFQVERSGHVEERDNFAIIGEGTYVAEAMLYFRKHEAVEPPAMAMYHVWEALYIASRRVAAVSRSAHSISILVPPGKRSRHVSVYDLTPAGFKYMKKQFDNKFGIRKITRFPDLPKNCVEPFP